MKRILAVATLISFLIISAGSVSRADWKAERDLIGEVFYYIETYYLYNIDLTKCRYEIIKKMFVDRPDNNKPEKTACLDKFSHFETPEEMQLMRTQFEGHFGGIGAEIKEEKGEAFFVRARPNTPAERAGIKSGDTILKVRDEKETEGTVINSSNQAVEKIRGPVGTKVFITIRRAGKIFEISVVREDIKINSVETKEFGDIGYVQVKLFGETTADELEDALRYFRQNGKNRTIIDLRNNPGGLVNSALEMLYYFGKKDDDIMLTIKYKNQEDTDMIKDFSGKFVEPKTTWVKSFGEFNNLKIIILINGYSASASEIFSGTMKDWGYIILGEKSFGKGVGQSLITLNDGSTLGLTTFEFLVGNDKVKIHEIGVMPNIEVKWEKAPNQSDIDFVKEYMNSFGDPQKDPQLMKALELMQKM